MKRTVLTFTFIAALLCGCVREDDNILESFQHDPMTKVVSFSDEYDTGTILIKFDRQPDQALLSAVMDCEILSIEKLFRSTPGKEALESQFGLDRWYLATLAEGSSFYKTVKGIAALESVSLVQYNNIAEKASDCKVFPYEGADALTKSSDSSLPFNDPSLVDQWHYFNRGNASVAKTAKKGADINVIDTWKELTSGDPSIIVAVVDEGVKYSHPDLQANMWVNSREIPGNGIDDDSNGYVDDIHGYNFVDRGPITWGLDGDSGHGTHCAGTSAAVYNNGKGFLI